MNTTRRTTTLALGLANTLMLAAMSQLTGIGGQKCDYQHDSEQVLLLTALSGVVGFGFAFQAINYLVDTNKMETKQAAQLVSCFVASISLIGVSLAASEFRLAADRSLFSQLYGTMGIAGAGWLTSVVAFSSEMIESFAPVTK